MSDGALDDEPGRCLVTTFGVSIGRPSLDELDRKLLAAREATVNYDDVGITLRGMGWAAHRRVGDGDADFAHAVAGLRVWAPQRGIGAQIHPSDAALEQGATVLVVLPIGPVTMIAPDRVVQIVDERDRFGFAYGTLPGHPERGEESFVIELTPDGEVRATITVQAGPGNLLMRIAAPVVTQFQRRAIAGYLTALERYVEEHR
jgi:uncharacterized protein (UPF0548 family)